MYIHCATHNLNLVVNGAVKAEIVQVCDFFEREVNYQKHEKAEKHDKSSVSVTVKN